jgi:hypothetical protein
VWSAVVPAEIADHCSVVGWADAIDGFACDGRGLDVDELILVAGSEEDVVDALVDQLWSGFERSRRVVEGKVTASAAPPPACQASTRTSRSGRRTALSAAAFRSPMAREGHGPSVAGSVARSASRLACARRSSLYVMACARQATRIGNGPAGWAAEALKMTGSHARCRAGLVITSRGPMGHRVSNATPRSTSTWSASSGVAGGAG